MEFRKVLTLRGPNIWANFPVIEAWVDLGELKDRASDEIPGFNQRLMSWLPTMIEHRCSIGERGGFFERLRRGTYLAHILEHVTLELQTLSGHEVAFGRARETSEEGVYKVIFKYREEHVARECLQAARELCLAAVYDRPFDVAGTIERLRDLSQRVSLGPSTRAIVEAARARGIPTRRLNTDSLVQFGYGSRQRRIRAAETDRTGAIAQAMAQDKELDAHAAAGRGRAGARRAAGQRRRRRLGRRRGDRRARGRQAAGRQPGPRRGHEPQHARTSDGRLRRGATGKRRRDRREVRPGSRLPPAGRGRAAWWRPPAASRPTSWATASARSSELIDIVNQDPRRGEHHATSLSKIHLDVICAGRAHRTGLRARFGAARRADRADPPQRQPEHRRHGDRRDRARASGSGGPRDRCRPRDRAGRRRHRHPGPGHQPADGRAGGDRGRGQRGPRAAHAPGAVGRRVAAGRRGDRRFALRPQRNGPHSHRGRHRRERQDDRHALHRAHPQGHGPPRGHDLHRRHLHQRPPHRQGRLQRPAERRQRAA